MRVAELRFLVRAFRRSDYAGQRRLNDVLLWTGRFAAQLVLRCLRARNKTLTGPLYRRRPSAPYSLTDGLLVSVNGEEKDGSTSNAEKLLNVKEATAPRT